MKITLLCLLSFIGISCFGQEIRDYNSTFNPDTLLQERKTNPIVYVETFFGGAFGRSHGLIAGFSANYQYKSHLFTARYTGLLEQRRVGSFIYIPFYRTEEEVEEFALLYGYRVAGGNLSYSLSGGASVVHREMYHYDDYNNTSNVTSRTRFSFPFEFSIKWFKKEKAPYRIYCLFPVGPPTGLGHSFGFKVVGNVGATTFVGLGITWGWGWHKRYY